MQSQKIKIYISLIITVVLVCAGLIYYYSSHISDDEVNNEVKDDVNSVVQINFPDAEIIYQAERNLSPENRIIFEQRLSDALNQLEESDDQYSAYINIGHYKKALGDYQGALDAYNKSAEINPETYVIWVNIGNLCKDMKDYKQAEKSYQKGIEVAPSFNEPYLALMDLYWYHSNLTDQELRIMFDKLLADKNNYYIRAKYGQYLEQEEYIDDAIKLWEEYLQYSPDDEDVKEILVRLRNL